jgi:DNA-binding response OmpR family regulator
MVDRRALKRAVRHAKAMRDLYARMTSQTVLCVDSNPYFCEFVRWFISDVGCEVAVAATGEEALSVIRRNPRAYDILIIADWLPDMDGAQLLQTLRCIPVAGRITITTSVLSPDQRILYESLGAASVLTTPFGFSELMRVLEPIAASNSGSH